MLYSGSLDASPSVVSRDSPHDGSCAAYFAPRGDEGFPWPDLYGQVPVPCFPPTPFQSHQVFNPYLISGNSENNTSVSPHDAAVNPATITTAPHPISLDPRDLLREIVRPIVEEELSARLSMSSASTLSSPHSPYLSLGTPLRSDEFGRESWQNINQAVCDPFPTEVQSTDINQDTESLFHIALTPQTYTTDAITVLPDATPTIQLPHSPRTSGGPLVCGFQGCGKSFINREKLRYAACLLFWLAGLANLNTGHTRDVTTGNICVPSQTAPLAALGALQPRLS